MVRAKMYVTSIQKGLPFPAVELNAVYEGSEALQKISDNAMFGRATPSGNMSLSGIGAESFEGSEEYFVELTPRDEEAVAIDPLFSTVMVKVHRSDEPKEWQEYSTIQYRFNSHSPDRMASLYMTINNRGAIDLLDEHRHYTMVVRKAVGRRSDEEIKLREELLEQGKKQLTAYPEGHQYHDSSLIHVANLQKKLARARGEL